MHSALQYAVRSWHTRDLNTVNAWPWPSRAGLTDLACRSISPDHDKFQGICNAIHESDAAPGSAQVLTGGEVDPAPAELGHAGAGGFSNDTFVLDTLRWGCSLQLSVHEPRLAVLAPDSMCCFTTSLTNTMH